MFGGKPGRLLVGLVVVGLVAGCSGTIHTKSRLGPMDTLSIDARQRLVLSGYTSDGRHVVCAEPSPDAIVARAAVLAGQGSGLLGPRNVNAQLAGGSSESAGGIGLRTPIIQVMRDGYYRLCEALLNEQIGPEEYEHAVANIGPLVVTLMALESLGLPRQAPAVAIGATASTGQASDSAGAPLTLGAIQPHVGSITIQEATISKEAAAAVVDVIEEYYRERERIAREVTRHRVR